MSGALLRRAAFASDQEPDAVNWANISGASPASNAAQTVSGIVGALPVGWAGDAFALAGGTLSYILDGGAATPIAAATPFNVTNGQTLAWEAALGSPGGPYTIQVRYGTGLATVWDSFTVTIT